jgi:hypothetical protein
MVQKRFLYMLRHKHGFTTALAITALAIAGVDRTVEAHSLTKTTFAPSDGSVLFTHDFGDMGSIPVIY